MRPKQWTLIINRLRFPPPRQFGDFHFYDCFLRFFVNFVGIAPSIDIINTSHMNKKLFRHYEAPTTEVVELQIHGIVCQSILTTLTTPDDYVGGDDPFIF